MPTTAEESLDKLRVMMQGAADDNGSTYYLFTEDVKREARSWIPYAMCEEDLTSWHRANWVMKVSPHRPVEVR